MKCPGCGSDKVRRSHRRDLERFLGHFSPRTLYRCRECGRRFWEFKIPLKSWASRVIVGISVLLIALLLLMPLQDRRSDKIKKEDLSEDIKKSETILSKTYSGKIEKPPDTEKMVFHHQISKEVISHEGTEPNLSTSKKNKQTKQPITPFHVERPASPPLVTLTPQTSSDSTKRNIPSDTGESLKEFYYSLHIGSFKIITNAKERVELLTKKGQYAWWKKVNVKEKGELFRVYIGKHENRTEALNFGKRLKGDGVIEYFSVHKLKGANKPKN